MRTFRNKAAGTLVVVGAALLFAGCASGLTPSEKMMWSTYLIASPKGVATCVIVNRRERSAPHGIVPILLTSAHVLTVDPDGPFYLAYRRPQPGLSPEVNILVIDAPSYVRHPAHDVAALEIRLPPELLDVVSLPSFLEEDAIEAGEGEPHPGDDVSVLGFPSVFPGTRGAFPVLRAGRIASYSPGPATNRETFLINTNVYSGDSGGPVFGKPSRGKPKLLGLLTQRIGRKEGSVPLGVAINVSVLSETLKLEAARQRAPGNQSSEIPFPAQKNLQPASVRLLGPPGSLRKALGAKNWRRLGRGKMHGMTEPSPSPAAAPKEP